MCPDGGIGRRTVFRWRRSQGRGGSSPLLGTITFQTDENAWESSSKRFTSSICYDALLHHHDRTSALTPHRSVADRSSACYVKLPRQSPTGVFLRGNRYYYRRTIPSDVQWILRRREIWRSLRTDSLSIALRRLPKIAAAIETELEEARLSVGRDIDQMLLRPLHDDDDERRGTITVITPMTFGDAYRRYLDDPTHAWSPSTREAYETCRRLSVSVIGEDSPIATLGRAECRDFLEVLRFLPRNAAKRFPSLSPREASERSRRVGDIGIISAANANAIMGNLSSFLNWAVNEELLDKNPTRGLRLPDKVAKRDKRLPFSAVQLERIFSAPLYVGCLDGLRGYSKLGSERPRNARYWIPLIGLHTGARLGEICQLDVTDVRFVNDIPCIVISTTSQVGSTDKRVKTRASERVVPLHRRLMDAGLLSYAAGKQREGSTKLFDDIEVGERGSRSVVFSKWFTQFLRNCGARRERTSFHSFRHNFRDELRSAHIEHDIAMMLGGWTMGAASKSVSENYGSGHRVEALHDAIEKLQFADIDLGHLARSAR